MKILFISLGCDKNRVDSEYMLGKLTGEDWEVTDDESQADVIVVNTCCFINAAKEESIGTILDMAKYKDPQYGHCRALIMAGCMAQRYQDEVMKEIPEVDACIGTNSTEKISEAIASALAGKKYEAFDRLDRIETHQASRDVSTGGHYAHLKIAEGCNKNCTYCIIPSLRGPYRSVPIEVLQQEAERLAGQGVRELILVAQETTVYGEDLYGYKALPKLLDCLNDIDGIEWIRLMYCYPEEIDEALLDAIIRNKKVCHYLDMPIQHINSDILRRMGRRTSREDILDRISMIRKKIPDIALRTTLICGFPGETETQHEELMQFINDTEFDRLGAFTYSQEEGTPAAEFPDQISEDVKEKWLSEVMELQEEVIFDKNETLIGHHMRAVIEGKTADDNLYLARTYRDAPDIDTGVFIRTDRNLISGDFVNVRITGSYDYDLIGELEDEFTE